MAFKPLDIQVNMQALNSRAEATAFQNSYHNQEALRIDESSKNQSRLKNSKVEETHKGHAGEKANSESREAVQDVLSRQNTESQYQGGGFWQEYKSGEKTKKTGNYSQEIIGKPGRKSARRSFSDGGRTGQMVDVRV